MEEGNLTSKAIKYQSRNYPQTNTSAPSITTF